MGTIFTGEVRAMPFDAVPAGWAPCNGQLLPLRGNTALFSLLGTTYGGDGKTNFGLPTLPPLEAETGTLHYCIALTGAYPTRP
jgi:microcystin-dependent protein